MTGTREETIRETIWRIELSNPPGVLSVMMSAEALSRSARATADSTTSALAGVISSSSLRRRTSALAPVLAAIINNQSAAAMIVFCAFIIQTLADKFRGLTTPVYHNIDRSQQSDTIGILVRYRARKQAEVSSNSRLLTRAVPYQSHLF